MLKLFPFGSWFYCHFENLWKEGKSEKQEVFTGFPTTFTSYEIYDSKALTPPRRPPPPLSTVLPSYDFPILHDLYDAPSSDFGEYLWGLSSHYSHTVRKLSVLIVKKQFFWLPFTYFDKDNEMKRLLYFFLTH